jgi:exodeoxyribonuclease VII large subunit
MNNTVWSVGALCKAVADALNARFNPIAVRGEISGFSRASSGHCYFVLKDETGQLRCAMFRRAASSLTRLPREGEAVELTGRLAVYEARGELQLVVDSLKTLGQGNLFEEFLRLKAKLELEGLFAADRKKAIKTMPRSIGVVTSLGAAALHDVATALQRRVPHIPVVLSPALVQGVDAPESLMAALKNLYQHQEIDVILLVRGGGSLEDLWSFNNEALVRLVAASPVPVISGVGHETDFTLTDFAADLRAPTPTAAAELCAAARADLLQWLDWASEKTRQTWQNRLDQQEQALDRLQQIMGRPSQRLADHQSLMQSMQHRLQTAMRQQPQRLAAKIDQQAMRLIANQKRLMQYHSHHWSQLQLRLQSADPKLVLRRGYAWLKDRQQQPIGQLNQLPDDKLVTAVLVDGEVDLQVVEQRRLQLPTIG